MRHGSLIIMLACAAPVCVRSQVLVDSIPYPDISQGFWGISVNADTIFLGDDFSGDIYFSDHAGNILGQLPTGFAFDHGMIKRPGSYLIAQDFTTNGAHLYEVGLTGTLMNTWTFPDVIGGHSSGIGDLCADGNAVWYTMYYPDFDVYPYAYAYKWVPGDPTPIDTVPMQGEQPYGIALKGDTLFYVTDNLNGDLERIYAYDLTNEQLIGSVPLPDSDNDQSPRGLFYDGVHLYLVANRSGSAAFAYQTVFIYEFDPSMFVPEPSAANLVVHPSPADEMLVVDGIEPGSLVTLVDMDGRELLRTTTRSYRTVFDVSALPAGACMLVAHAPSGERSFAHCMIAH